MYLYSTQWMPERIKKNDTTSVFNMSKNKQKNDIPPPPGPNAAWQDQAAYFEKYEMDQLKEAGHLEPLSEEDEKFIGRVKEEAGQRISARQTRAQLNLALSQEQLNRFTRYANKKHIPPSTLAKAWILERLDQEAKDL